MRLAIAAGTVRRRRVDERVIMAAFARYVGIDYSGAETPTASLKGLRVYASDRASPPVEVMPPPSPRKYWTRRGVAEWLVERLAKDAPILVGIDHGFSFPLRYFEVHALKPDWPAFLDDFQHHWPTDDDHTYVDFVREGAFGNGAARMGNARWRRLDRGARRRAQNRCFISTFRDRWRNPRTPGFRGCGSSAKGWPGACISGRSTAGTFRQGAPPSLRSIRRYGTGASHARTARRTSMMPTASRPGSTAPTRTVASERSLSLIWRRPNAP